MIKITIVIPVYNGEKTVGEAIKSLLEQDLQEMEVIAVDDGSTDGTYEVCSEIAKEDPRVTVIHTENRGAPSARATGIDAAKGEYIMFLDADDFYLPSSLKKLADAADETKCDMLAGGITMVERSGGRRRLNPPFSGVYEGERLREIYEKAVRGEDRALINLYDKVYSKEFLKNKEIKFPPIISGEDCVFSLDAMLSADRITFFDDFPFYGYVDNPISFTRRSMPVEKRIDYSDAFFNELEILLKKHNVEDLKGQLDYRKTLAVYDFVMMVSSNSSLSKEEKKKAVNYIAERKYYTSALTDELLAMQSSHMRLVCKSIRSKKTGKALFLANAISRIRSILR